jgi:4-hydroxy-2-oxoheptanedioate aldolase
MAGHSASRQNRVNKRAVNNPSDHLSATIGRIMRSMTLAAAALAVLSLSRASAQGPSVHLNPVVAKLVDGKVVYGLMNSGDLSLANARETARAPIDFVYADMEHSPLDFPGLQRFLLGLTDKAAILAKGNLQPNVALFARFPPEVDQSQWVVKQALDIGLMGVIFNGVSTKDQAVAAVRMMRYPPMKGSTRPEPVGIRGFGPAAASWAWGLSLADYERRADVWPLNPEGDLLAIPMVESVDGLKNVDEIASVPGVGALFLGGREDLARSMGLRSDSPDVEAAVQQVLRACKSRKVACGISALNGADVARRVKEGWNLVRTTLPALAEGRALMGER